MLIEIGHVEAICRYPVKSMAGEQIETANLGWYGLDGDRRLAFRRMDDRSGMPWLTASKLPDLLLFAPQHEDGAQGDLPTRIRTPDGEEMPVFGEDLAKEVGRRYGAPVQMMQLRHGIFDEASISVIASDTVREIGRLAGRSLDIRRFRSRRYRLAYFPTHLSLLAGLSRHTDRCTAEAHAPCADRYHHECLWELDDGVEARG